MTKKDITTYYKDQINDLINNGNYSDEYKDLLQRLSEYDGEDIDSAVFHNDANGIIHEIADNCVDIYHADRFKWLSDNYNNASYVEDAVSEYGYNFDKFNLSDLIALGQFKYNFDMLNDLIKDLNDIIPQYSEDEDEDITDQ